MGRRTNPDSVYLTNNDGELVRQAIQQTLDVEFSMYALGNHQVQWFIVIDSEPELIYNLMLNTKQKLFNAGFYVINTEMYSACRTFSIRIGVIERTWITQLLGNSETL